MSSWVTVRHSLGPISCPSRDCIPSTPCTSTVAISPQSKQGAAPGRHRVLLLDFVDEVVLGFRFVAGSERHLAAGVPVFAGAAGDRQLRGFSPVVEGALDGQLAA